MGTRGVIARSTGEGFEGRYHHWDSYPTGLGQTLFTLYRERYDGDAEAMRRELIDEHPAGWSTINGADWSQAPGFHDSQDYVCTICGREAWEHYRQNYRSHGLPEPEPFEPGSYAVFDHAPERPNTPEPPQCYCHGGRGETEQLVTSDGDDCGTEWAYVIGDDGLGVFERRWNDDGGHMVGMFGQGAGADGGSWLRITTVDWDSEPDWESIEAVG